MTDLFGQNNQQPEELLTDVYLMRGLADADQLLPDIKQVISQAPLRFMRTPGGKRLNISMTNCGQLGWISEPTGYRYAQQDPTSGQPWPDMPESFRQLAMQASGMCGFPGFSPNACLVNHYQAGQELTAHQDKNEPDLSQPIVSVSLGMSARFQIYGDSRSRRPLEVELYDGDVMVWGRSARLIYHGVKTNRSMPHPNLGLHRFNLTMRQV
jgi:alkylated DNA repair protein (DNA oxidative demethylase)